MLYAIMEGKSVKTPKEFMGVVEPSVVGRSAGVSLDWARGQADGSPYWCLRLSSAS